MVLTMRGCHLTVAIVSVLLMAPSCRRSADPQTKFGGTWTVKFGARTFTVLALTQSGDSLTGTLIMPERFEIGPAGFRFTNISSAVAQRQISDASIQGDRLHFLTINPKNTHDADAFDLTRTGNDVNPPMLRRRLLGTRWL